MICLQGVDHKWLHHFLEGKGWKVNVNLMLHKSGEKGYKNHLWMTPKVNLLTLWIIVQPWLTLQELTSSQMAGTIGKETDTFLYNIS